MVFDDWAMFSYLADSIISTSTKAESVRRNAEQVCTSVLLLWIHSTGQMILIMHFLAQSKVAAPIAAHTIHLVNKGRPEGSFFFFFF
jgi:hypothetical protein